MTSFVAHRCADCRGLIRLIKLFTMRSFKIPLIITLFVSLGFGIGLGLKLKRDRAAHLGVVTGSRKLKVLALKGALPSDFLRSFAASENIQIDLAEEATPDMVFARLKGPSDFDLVTLMTTQVGSAMQASKLQPIKTDMLAGFNSVSRDFVDLPGHAADVVPIFWGVNDGLDVGKLALADLSLSSEQAFKAGQANETGLLWILNFAMTENAKNIEEAKSFLTFILKPDAAAALSQSVNLSSTNSGLDQKSIDPRLKASALRQIPLTDLRLVFDPQVVKPKPTPPVIEKMAPKSVEKPPARPARREQKSEESDDEDAGE